MHKILYIYESWHPVELRDFIKSKLEPAFPNFQEISYSAPNSEIIDNFSVADALFMAPGRYLDDEVHKAGKNLKIIQLWSSGYDKINKISCQKYNQVVANNGGANSQSVGEHTLLLMLSAARRLAEMHNRVISGNWAGNGVGLNLQTLFGTKLGIIGMGKIGSKVAVLANAFGMKIQYYDISTKLTPPPPHYCTRLSFEELITSSDFISLHIHPLKDGKPILGLKEFNIMKKGVNIINTSRASLIDFTALKGAIETDRVRYYSADVFTNEPTSQNEPEFACLNNVTLTPHIAGSNLETYELVMKNCIENINLALNGKEIKWRVL